MRRASTVGGSALGIFRPTALLLISQQGNPEIRPRRVSPGRCCPCPIIDIRFVMWRDSIR